MSLETYVHKFPYGKGLKLTGDRWYTARFGLFNLNRSGTVDPETVEELEETAQVLDYQDLDSNLMDTVAKRFYGGSIETPHGKLEWMGEPPEEAQKFIQEIRNAIDG